MPSPIRMQLAFAMVVARVPFLRVLVWEWLEVCVFRGDPCVENLLEL